MCYEHEPADDLREQWMHDFHSEHLFTPERAAHDDAGELRLAIAMGFDCFSGESLSDFFARDRQEMIDSALALEIPSLEEIEA